MEKNVKTNVELTNMSESTANFVKKNFAKRIELRIMEASCLESATENLKLVSGYIDVPQFIPTFNFVGNEVNPRSAVKNPVVTEIVAGLYENPAMFPFKSKGMTFGTKSCRKTGGSKYSIELVQGSAVAVNSPEASWQEADPRFAGIVDGGHSALAVASYIVGVLYNKHFFIFKNWTEAKDFFKANYAEIIERYGLLEGKRKEMLNLTIPVQIVAPLEENACANYKKRLPSICSGRNKSAQLSIGTLANHAGIYEYFKEVFPEFPILWKDGDTSMKKKDSIASADIVKLTAIPFSFLAKEGLIEVNKGEADKKKFYSSRKSCVTAFEHIASNPSFCTTVEGEGCPILTSSLIKSAIDMTKDIAKYADRLFAEFPTLVNNTHLCRFGMLKEVSVKSNKDYPYKTSDRAVAYKYPTSYLAALIAGVTELMRYNAETGRLEWIVNPASEAFKVGELDITKLVILFNDLHFRPNECGKTTSCFNTADEIYQDYIIRHPQTGVKVA